MVSGQYEEAWKHASRWCQSAKASSSSSGEFEAPVKQESRWLQYISDEDYGRLGSSYSSLGPLEPLHTLEPLEPTEPLEPEDPREFSATTEQLDLPDLDFPVPAQDLIPEMVRENDLGASTPTSQTDADVDAAALLIPIQGSIVAHSRSGRPSLAAVTERRVKNTEAARRSRARRNDKLMELRERNEELSKRNVALIAENEQLRAIVRAMEDKLHINEH